MARRDRSRPSAALLMCVECNRTWTDPRERGWQAHLTLEAVLTFEGETLAIYCPDCADAEFGD